MDSLPPAISEVLQQESVKHPDIVFGAVVLFGLVTLIRGARSLVQDLTVLVRAFREKRCAQKNAEAENKDSQK